MTQKVFLLVSLLFFLSAVSSVAMDRGSTSIEINGGPKGNITFPHHEHQDLLGDCKICHDIFPQKKGAIADSVAKGDLKKKQVMNKTCIQCHRDRKKAGQSFGPVNCNDCHKK